MHHLSPQAAKKARNRLSQSAQLLSVSEKTDSEWPVGRSNKRRPTYSRQPAAKLQEKSTEKKLLVTKPAAGGDLGEWRPTHAFTYTHTYTSILSIRLNRKVEFVCN